MATATSTQHGYLVLADISGYTSYLAGVELDHAHEILTDLLEIIVRQLTGVLTFAKLEGDAVFAYAPESRVPRGEVLLELIQATYAAFRDRRDAVDRRTVCECRACHAVAQLDLKFLVHHGDYIVQQVATVRELVGSDVNLIHRLLKNHLGQATGWRAYALFTEAGLEHMGLRPQGLHAQTEHYEHLGAVQTFGLDLHPLYDELKDARRLALAPAEADTIITLHCAAPPAVVWDWLNNPARRLQWEHTEIVPVLRPVGRTAIGARNHCVHGKDVIMQETVLDWRPFEYFTVEKAMQLGPPMCFTVTFRLDPLPEAGTTRVTTLAQARLGRMPRFIMRQVCRAYVKLMGIDLSLRRLEQMVNERESEGEASQPALLAAR